MRWSGPALLVALLLASYLPAAAQNLVLPARFAPGATPTFSARLQFPLFSATANDSERLASVVPADYRGHNHSPEVESTVDYVKTPFVEQTRLPLARFSGGRFEFSGFDALRPMENVLLGPAWRMGTQAHPAIWVPLADQSYGVSLSINLKHGPQSEHPLQFWRCLARVVGAVHGCHLN